MCVGAINCVSFYRICLDKLLGLCNRFSGEFELITGTDFVVTEKLSKGASPKFHIATFPLYNINGTKKLSQGTSPKFHIATFPLYNINGTKKLSQVLHCNFSSL